MGRIFPVSSFSEGTGPFLLAGCHVQEGRLVGLPDRLPPGCFLSLDDRLPIAGLSPAAAAEEIAELSPVGLYLDFQRPENPDSRSFAEGLLPLLPFPVGISAPYAVGLSCPVVLPPRPLHLPYSRYYAPWQGRQIWQEGDLSRWSVVVDGSGCHPLEIEKEAPDLPGASVFQNDVLFCRYTQRRDGASIAFTLWNNAELLQQELLACPAEVIFCLPKL